jgi:Na+-driven multidrug efflux pump
MLIGAGLNLILDPIFLFVLDMGIKGAALATVLAQSVSAAWVIYYYLSGKSHLKLLWKNIRINPASAKLVTMTGSPQFLLNIIACVSQAIIYNSLHFYGGDTEIAVMGVIFTIAMLVFMPMIGISQGTQPIIGYNYGAEKYSRVRQTAIMAIILSTGICVAMYIVIITIPQWLFIPFGGDDNFITIGTHAIRRYMLCMPLVGTIFVTSNFFQAVAKPNKAIFLALVRQVITFIPALLILPRFIGVDGIWYSCAVSDGVSFTIAAALIIKELTKHKYRHI